MKYWKAEATQSRGWLCGLTKLLKDLGFIDKDFEASENFCNWTSTKTNKKSNNAEEIDKQKRQGVLKGRAQDLQAQLDPQVVATMEFQKILGDKYEQPVAAHLHELDPV